jgi:hypothetical protein
MNATAATLIALFVMCAQSAQASDQIKKCVSAGKTTFTNIDCGDIDKVVVPPTEAVIPTEIKRIGKNGEILDSRQLEKQKSMTTK